MLAINVGGTFIDVLQRTADGELKSFKLPSSTPAATASTIAQATATSLSGAELLYSTTVTINSLLSGQLPRIGLIVTAGFRDILETARLPATDTATLRAPPPQRLVPLEYVREIDARIAASGVEQRPLDHQQVTTIAAQFQQEGIAVVAVSLLHSCLNPEHEHAVRDILRATKLAPRVFCSSDILPEAREFERSLTTALHASVAPVLATHLEPLIGDSKVWLMQSNGGLASAAAAQAEPLSTALAGPSAAVVGMRWWAEKSGFRQLITLDVGGTSTDVALIRDGELGYSTARTVAGFPFPVPMLDVISIGAGGGSIAREAADRRWHIGPESAAAIPGPACYGRGGAHATLTDAQRVLGRLPSALLGRTLPLDTQKAQAVLAEFGRGRGLDASATARGLLSIATHRTDVAALAKACG